jgi:hypothetical protein
VAAPTNLELSGRVVVLVGPGVVEAGALAELRAFAASGDLGVANTWGAKGVFAWDSPHHLGTCGLQARDFELLGFGEADTIVVSGLDPDESPRARVALAPVVEVDPTALGSAVGRVVRTGAPLPNQLYPRLAGVAQPGYVDDKVPLHPARVVAELGAALPPDGFLAAEPGLAGLWVARTFPTPALDPGAPRRVVVPARRDPGQALRDAVAEARRGRPSLAVTTTPLDHATAAGLDAVAGEDLALLVVGWSEDGPRRAAPEVGPLVRGAFEDRRPALLEVAVCTSDTRLLIEAAGDVVAWGGI